MTINIMGKDPVIIAGAGPVGCTLALYLARHNVPVVMLEGDSELPEDLRASTWHPPTLDMLDQLEITEELIGTGLKVPNYQYRDRRTGEYADFDLTMLGDETKHHYRLQTEQFRLTRIVCRILEGMPNAEVRFSHMVTNVAQDDDGVTVTMDTPEGSKDIRGSVVFGGDGANSAIRRKASIEFEGFTYPEKFLVATTPYPLEDHFPGLAWVNYVSDPDEWCVLLRCNNLWRCLFPTPPGHTNEQLLSDDYIQERLHFLADVEGDFDVRHRTLYNVHQRVAKTYRIGRILLGGDSAHVNNPLGGMGMNGGIHDVINLGEKLMMITKGEANDDILDLYDRQRRIVCKKFVQEQTIANKKAIEAADPESHKKQQEKYMKAAADPALAKPFLMRTSMIDSVKASYEIT
jgi:3-(3-hydroxy-phenyl)propionate hydroxylase